MNPISRIVEAVTGSDTDKPGQPAASGPAAASGDTQVPTAAPSTPDEDESEVSSGPSGTADSETGLGGADAVPDTPDGVPENYT